MFKNPIYFTYALTLAIVYQADIEDLEFRATRRHNCALSKPPLYQKQALKMRGGRGGRRTTDSPQL